MKKFNMALLPYIGAAAQAVLFCFAGVKAFGWWGWLIGPGVGITASLSVATASSNIGSITAKGRKQIATAGLILMVVFSASTVSLSLAFPESVWTAISWGCAVDISIVLAGAISGKGLVASETQAPKVAGKPKKEPVKEPEPLPQLTRKHVKDEDLLAYLAGNAGASQQQVADHFGVTRQAIGPRIKKLYEVKA